MPNNLFQSNVSAFQMNRKTSNPSPDVDDETPNPSRSDAIPNASFVARPNASSVTGSSVRGLTFT